MRLGLTLAVIVTRIPFFRHFDLVSYDGTYYLNQARALLDGSLAGGAFPPGYPLLVAPVLAIVRDPVRAGMLVSVLAAVGSVLLLHALLRRIVSPVYALAGAAILVVTPLFVQTSMLTASESAYLFWVMLALWLTVRERWPGAGAAIGMAAITRPEALAIAGVMVLMKWKRPRALAAMLAPLVLVYGLGVAMTSLARGEFTLLSRSGAYQSLATPWMLRETSVEYEGKDAVEDAARGQARELNRGAEYLRRLPADLGNIAMQMLPLLPALAVLGVRRRRDVVLAALAPLPFIPMFTEDRGVLRWFVAYLPPLIYYGMSGLASLPRGRVRGVVFAAVIACAAAAVVVNHRVLVGGVENEARGTRDAARRFRDRVQPGDRIASRKPYFPFYAGGHYVEIPVAPYDDAVQYLARTGVRFLALEGQSIHTLRPAFRPLLYDPTAIRGEVRYRQVLFEKSGDMVYERTLDSDPLLRRDLTTPERGDAAPAWSPDGETIAFRRHFADGTMAICVMDTHGGNVRRVVSVERMNDFLAWSPDGTRIAYSETRDDNMDVVAVEWRTGRVTRLTDHPARDYAPSWCRDTGEIVFGSERDGEPGVWVMPGRGGDARELTHDGEQAGLPSISPSGAYAAWTDALGRLVLLQRATGAAIGVVEPRGIIAPPAWSPDERTVAVGSYDWGSAEIYLVNVDDGRALMLTKTANGEGMPAWSPDGREIVIAAGSRNDVRISVLGNLEGYLARLREAYDFGAFSRPAETRVPPGAK